MRAALLRRCSGPEPNSAFEIELIPTRAENFAAPCAAQQDQMHCIGGRAIGMHIERGGESPDFFG